MAYLHQKKSYLKKTKFSVNAVMILTSMPTDAGNSFLLRNLISCYCTGNSSTDLHGLPWSRLLRARRKVAGAEILSYAGWQLDLFSFCVLQLPEHH